MSKKNCNSGIKTHVVHVRGLSEDDSYAPGGGFTFVFRCIRVNDALEIKYAVAECSSSDLFNKKIGRSIARARLDNEHCCILNIPLTEVLETALIYPVKGSTDELSCDVTRSVLDLRHEVIKHASEDSTFKDRIFKRNNRFCYKQETEIDDLEHTINEFYDEVYELLNEDQRRTLLFLLDLIQRS